MKKFKNYEILGEKMKTRSGQPAYKRLIRVKRECDKFSVYLPELGKVTLRWSNNIIGVNGNRKAWETLLPSLDIAQKEKERIGYKELVPENDFQPGIIMILNKYKIHIWVGKMYDRFISEIGYVYQITILSEPLKCEKK